MSAPLHKLSDITGPIGNSQAPRLSDPLQLLALSDPHVDERRRWAEETLRQQQDFEDPSVEVAKWVREQFEHARQNKLASGVVERDQLCLRHRRSQYSQEECARFAAAKQEAVFFPMPDRHCRSLKAFIRNILTPDDNHPLWDLEATPIPEVPDAVARRAAEELVRELAEEALATGVDLPPEVLTERIETLRDELLEAVREDADESVDRAQEIIEDNLQRTKFTTVMDDFLDDFVTRPAAILAGPEVAVQKEMVWENGNHVAKDYKYLRVRTADPDRIYPSADSTTTQDGEYMIELGLITRGELSRSRNLTNTGFIAKNIEAILREYESAPRDWLSHAGSSRTDLLMDKVQRWAHDESIDVIKYYGKIEGRMLKLAGVDKFRGKDVDEMEYYEVVLWVVGDLIIRAGCAVDPLGERPFHKATAFPIVGSFWGNGLPNVINEFTRMANATMRSWVANMGYISKPIFEMDVARWDTKSGQKLPSNVVPGQMLYGNSMGGVGNGNLLEVTQITPVVEHLIRSLDTLTKYAEEMSGLPSFLSGQPATGGAARTLGGFNSLQQNVGIGLRSMVVSIDQDALEPILAMFYRYLMATTDDPSLKADAKIAVHGATQLLARELGRERVMQAINVSLPFAQSGLVKTDGVSVLLRQLYDSLGFNPDDIVIDGTEAQQRQQEIQPQLGLGGGVAGGVPAQSGPGGVAATQTPPVPVAQAA